MDQAVPSRRAVHKGKGDEDVQGTLLLGSAVKSISLESAPFAATAA